MKACFIIGTIMWFIFTCSMVASMESGFFFGGQAVMFFIGLFFNLIGIFSLGELGVKNEKKK